MKKWIISTIFIFALIFTTGNTFANDNDDDENNDNLAHDEELNVSVNQSVTNDNTNNNLNKNSNDVDIKIENNGFGFHVELPIKAYFRGATFLEIPIHYEKSPKESTLRYHKQFFSYMNPVFWGFLQRIKHIFSVF